MPAPYSQDLRDRVASAISSGSSARGAAKRFGIGIGTAVRWAQRLRAEGHARARAMGGDRRSRLTGTSGSRADADRPPAGPDAGGDPRRADRAARHHRWPGHRLALSRRSQHHPQKKVCTPPSSSVLTWPRPATPSSGASPLSIRSAWCSSTRPRQQPT